MELCLEEMESYLSIEQSDVRTIGICGRRGIGKTALANEVFPRFSYQFAASCFLPDVGPQHENHGPVRLRKQLYERLLDTKEDIRNVKGLFVYGHSGHFTYSHLEWTK